MWIDGLAWKRLVISHMTALAAVRIGAGLALEQTAMQLGRRISLKTTRLIVVAIAVSSPLLCVSIVTERRPMFNNHFGCHPDRPGLPCWRPDPPGGGESEAVFADMRLNLAVVVLTGGAPVSSETVNWRFGVKDSDIGTGVHSVRLRATMRDTLVVLGPDGQTCECHLEPGQAAAIYDCADRQSSGDNEWWLLCLVPKSCVPHLRSMVQANRSRKGDITD